MHMSACELRDYARVRRASVSPDGSVRASVASNRHTTGCMHNTHICYVGVVVRSCPWWHYLSSTTPVPTAHGCETTSSGGDAFAVARFGPRIYWTHMLMEQTQGWEKDPSSKATWLYTTFTSTQHFQASKQPSQVPNTSQPAKSVQVQKTHGL